MDVGESKMAKENLMYELKDCTHYYLYTNGEHIFITDKAPVRRDNLRWYHPEIDTLKCIQTLYVDLLTEHQYFEFEKYKEEKYGKKMDL
jgi:hypothetical protein